MCSENHVVSRQRPLILPEYNVSRRLSQRKSDPVAWSQSGVMAAFAGGCITVYGKLSQATVREVTFSDICKAIAGTMRWVR